MSPIYKSGGKDNGYDVVNHVEIDPKLGTLEDFKDLVQKLHDAGIKLIMDFIPNHTSEDHQWFQESKKSDSDAFSDFYVWKECTGPSNTPNNWKSVFGGNAWTYDSTRQKCYLHQFYKEQPDLNLRNKKVVEELKKIMKFWLDLGVDGFRVDSVAHFFEDENFEDEQPKVGDNGQGYESYDHTKTLNLPDVLTLLKEFRSVLDNKTEEDTYNPRIMMTEDYNMDKIASYYGKPGKIIDQIGPISHMPLFFGMIEKFPVGAQSIANKAGADIVELVKNTIQGYQNGLPFDNKTEQAIFEYNALSAEEKKEEI